MENISQDFVNNPEEENVYRALRDSVLQLHNFVAETARKSNPSYLVDISWDIRDHSLINWISFSRCFLIRQGTKIQFLSKPRFLENITIELHKGDKILICSDTLLDDHSDADLDELVKNSANVDDACQKLLHLSHTEDGKPSEVNIVVMEVREPSANVMNSLDAEPTVQAVVTPTTKTPATKEKSNGTWWLIPLLLVLAGLAYWLFKGNLMGGLLSGNASVSDTANLQDTSYYIKNDTIQKNIKVPSSTESPSNPDSSGKSGFEAVTTVKKAENVVPEKPKKQEPAWEEPKTTTTPKAVEKNTEKKTTASNSNTLTGSSSTAKTALEGQLARWKKIKEDLQAEVNAGKPMQEELQNANEVLQRIEKKLRGMN